MRRVPITDLVKEVLYRLLGYTVKPVGKVVRFFRPPKPGTNVMPAPLVRVFYNATELAYVMGDREIAPMHLSFAVELDGRVMQHRYWGVMQLTPEAQAVWKAAIDAAGNMNQVTVRNLRAALASAK